MSQLLSAATRAHTPREVGELYTGFIWAPQLRVGNATTRIAALHNERVSAWAVSDPFWPRIASFPRDSGCSSDQSVGMSLDAQDHPVLVVLGCSGALQIFRQVGTYPEDWNERCQDAIVQLCDLACDCAPEGPGDCGYAYSSGYTPGGNRSGCELGARDNLCGDSTSSPEELATCVATLEPATCGIYGYPVNDACLPLVE